MWPVQPAAALRTALGWTLCWLQTMPLAAVWYSEEPLHRAIQLYRFAARGPSGCETDSRREALNHHLLSDGHRGPHDIHSALVGVEIFFQIDYYRMNGRPENN